MLFSSILFPLVGVFRSFRLFLSFALSNYLPPCLSLTHTRPSSSTDGSAAFLFQGSRQQSSHYRNKTTRRSALWKKEKLREARVALLGEERDHGGSGSPDRPYHLVRNRHHMSKQRDIEKEERNYYVARPETMIRLVEHAATNNNIRSAPSVLVHDACCKCNEPTGPRRSIVFTTGVIVGDCSVTNGRICSVYDFVSCLRFSRTAIRIYYATKCLYYRSEKRHGL